MSPPSYVYFIRPIGMLGPVKIGYSIVPEGRLETLAAWSPFPLEIAATTPGSWQLEQTLHRRFHAAHLHREWFNPVPDLIRAIQTLRAGFTLEEAIDFSTPGQRLPRRPARWDGLRRSVMSYTNRVHCAVKRADKRAGAGGNLRSPHSISRIISAISYPERRAPTDEEARLLEDFIANPYDKVVHIDVLYPKRVAA